MYLQLVTIFPHFYFSHSIHLGIEIRKIKTNMELVTIKENIFISYYFKLSPKTLSQYTTISTCKYFRQWWQYFMECWSNYAVLFVRYLCHIICDNNYQFLTNITPTNDGDIQNSKFGITYNMKTPHFTKQLLHLRHYFSLIIIKQFNFIKFTNLIIKIMYWNLS